MSRLAKKPIAIPAKSEVSCSGGVLTIKGPLGTLQKVIKDDVSITVDNGNVVLGLVNDSIRGRALWGTYASHIRNMLAGVNKAYEKKLIVEGIGYKADVKGKDLVLAVGFSHPVVLPIPEGLKVTVEKTTITISGIDCEIVGQFSAVVRATKKPEPYLGKGIRFSDEVIRRKQGKKAT